MRPSATRLRRLALIVTVVLAAACGSTAPMARQADPQGAGATAGVGHDELSLWSGEEAQGGGIGPGGDLDVESADRQQTAGAGGGLPAGAPAAPRRANPSGGQAAEAAADRASGRGFTKTAIMMGVPLPRDSGAANEALGGAGLAPGDERRYMEAAVKEVNRTGGIAGRKVVPVVYEMEEVSPQTWEQQWQAACTYWTEDKPVFAALIEGTMVRDSVRACLNQRGVPAWRGGFHSNTDAVVHQRFPLWVEVTGMHLGRLSRNLADGLADQDYFSPPDGVGQMRLGLVRYESPVYDRVAEQELKPALRRHGVEIAEEVEATEPNGVKDASAVSAQMSNAVLRFRSRGITHVLFLEETALMAALFMKQAEGQEYRPRYGLHSLNGGQAALVPNVPERQLEGAIGIGYSPVYDVPLKHASTGPGSKRCTTVMRRAGLGFPSQFARYNAMSTCDAFFSLQAAGNGAPEPLSAGGLIAGLHGLGDSFVSAVTLRTSFSNQRRDGAAAYRHVAWFTGCTCFKYTSQLLPAR